MEFNVYDHVQPTNKCNASLKMVLDFIMENDLGKEGGVKQRVIDTTKTKR